MRKTTKPVAKPVAKPKPVKPPKGFHFNGEAGKLDINVEKLDNGGIVLDFGDTYVSVIPNAKGRRFVTQLLKFVQQLDAYLTANKVTK